MRPLEGCASAQGLSISDRWRIRIFADADTRSERTRVAERREVLCDAGWWFMGRVSKSAGFSGAGTGSRMTTRVLAPVARCMRSGSWAARLSDDPGAQGRVCPSRWPDGGCFRWFSLAGCADEGLSWIPGHESTESRPRSTSLPLHARLSRSRGCVFRSDAPERRRRLIVRRLRGPHRFPWGGFFAPIRFARRVS